MFFDIFGEIHKIQGEEVCVIVDETELKETKIETNEGVFQGDLLFYARRSEMKRPDINDRLRFDSNVYSVIDVKDENQIYKITLMYYAS